MTDAVNRQWLLAKRPSGIIDRDAFEWREAALPEIADGEILVRNLWLSCDAAQRAWMVMDTYIPMLPLGEVMASASAGEVVESKNPDFEPGDLVSGAFGWQDYAVTDSVGFGGGIAPPLKIPSGIEVPDALSLFGITGLTAYFGLLDVGKAKEGDTVLVSAAAGAVGSVVCQIAKAKGCRVVGIAGGESKCAWLRNELGVDEAVDYKNDDLRARFRECCPSGADVYFDNVGGEILDAALANLAFGARIVICGALSGYSDPDGRYGIKNHTELIMKGATMQGFLVFTFLDRVEQAVAELAGWVAEGKLKNQIDVVEGLENAPDALRRLFTGANLGKQLIKVAEPGGAAA